MIEKALEFVEKMVDDDMNKYLEGEFGEEEIRRAVLDINASKATGPDGYSASFFHNLWDDVKDDICKEVKNILNH